MESFDSSWWVHALTLFIHSTIQDPQLLVWAMRLPCVAEPYFLHVSGNMMFNVHCLGHSPKSEASIVLLSE